MPTKGQMQYQDWSCDSCDAKGTLMYLSTDDAGQIMARAIRQHNTQRPICKGRVRLVERQRGVFTSATMPTAD